MPVTRTCLLTLCLVAGLGFQRCGGNTTDEAKRQLDGSNAVVSMFEAGGRRVLTQLGGALSS